MMLAIAAALKSKVWNSEPTNKNTTQRAEKIPANANFLVEFISAASYTVAAHAFAAAVCAKQSLTYVATGTATRVVSVHTGVGA